MTIFSRRSHDVETACVRAIGVEGYSPKQRLPAAVEGDGPSASETRRINVEVKSTRSRQRCQGF